MANRKLKPIHYILISVGLLIVVAIVAKKAGWIGKKEDEKVTVESTDLRTITETVLANGKVQPEVELKVSSEVSGEIVGLYVAEGDSVRKGQLLVKINPELILAAIDRATAAVNNAQANLGSSRARTVQAKAQFENIRLVFERNQKIHAQKVISDAEFDASKAQYEAGKQDIELAKQGAKASEFMVESAMASLKESRENLSRTSIFSAMNGIVTRLAVSLGERVVGTAQMAGTEMLRIANLSQMQSQVDVSENDIVRVSLGDTADIEIDAYPGKKFKGVVKEIANSSNSTTTNVSDQVTNFQVKISILRDSYADLSSKSKHPFRPGMSTSVEIKTDVADNTLTVPIMAVTVRSVDKSGKILNDDGSKKADRKSKKDENENEGSKVESTKENKQIETDNRKEVVFMYNKGIVKAVLVKTGIQDDQYIQIVEGVKKGDEIVSGPFSLISKKLKDGDKVKKVSEKELFSGDKK